MSASTDKETLRDVPHLTYLTAIWVSPHSASSRKRLHVMSNKPVRQGFTYRVVSCLTRSSFTGRVGVVVPPGGYRSCARRGGARERKLACRVFGTRKRRGPFVHILYSLQRMFATSLHGRHMNIGSIRKSGNGSGWDLCIGGVSRSHEKGLREHDVASTALNTLFTADRSFKCGENEDSL